VPTLPCVPCVLMKWTQPSSHTSLRRGKMRL